MKPTGMLPGAAVLRALLLQFTLRHWRRQPGRTLLLVALLALGVAVFLSIRLANRAAVASFSNFTEVITQQADAVLAPSAGALPDSLLDTLSAGMADTGVALVPILETVAAPPRVSQDEAIGSRSTYTLLGVDLVDLPNLAARRQQGAAWFNSSPPASGSEPRAKQPELGEILQRPNAAFCSRKLATKHGLQIGSTLPIVLNEKTLELEIVGFIPEIENQPAPPENLLVLDLPALQKLADRTAQIDRIECVFPKGARAPAASAALFEKLRALAAPHAAVRTPDSRQAAAESMTRGFRLNLTILSLIALLVGMHLIFQTLDAAVVRRRPETAVLRSLGVGETAVRRAWLCEAALLGVAGGTLGVLLGWVMAQGFVRLVSQTVNSLYYATNVRAAALHADEAAIAVLLAIACSVLAGWLPAKTAASTPPAQLLAHGSGTRPSRARAFHPEAVGLLLCAAAVVLPAFPPVRLTGGAAFPLAGYAAALAGVIGASLLAGGVLGGLGRLAQKLAPNSAVLRLGASHVRHPSSRHRWAVAGLLCSIAMTGGMAILVGSFERTVTAWIRHTLHADLYITSDANQAATAFNRISPDTWRKIVQEPQVLEADTVLILPVELPRGRVRVIGQDLALSQKHNQFSWLEAPRDNSMFAREQNAAMCLVSESYAHRFRARPGDAVELPTSAGLQRLTIAGIYTDYSDEQGVVLVERAHLARWFATDQASTLSLLLKPGTDAEALRERLQRTYPGLAFFTNTHLRGEVLRIFRQTFAITHAMEGIGIAVALAGLGVTLASILTERRAELTTLRALGMRRKELAQAAACEGALLSLCGSVGGIATSLGLGALLVYVINKQTFGWTLQPAVPWGALALLALVLTASGAAVSWWVGLWGAQLPADREA